MTKMMREKRDRGTPRESMVTFPGQSQISSGMTVLVRPQNQELIVLVGRSDTHSYLCFRIRVVGSR